VAKKHSYEYIREYVKNLGYELISKEYKENHSILTLMDNIGYLYCANFNNISNGKFVSYKISKHNPHSIENISLWLKINNKPLIIMSEIYEGHNEKLTFKDFDGYYYSISYNGLSHCDFPRKFGTENKYTIQNIILWTELNNKPFRLLSKEYLGNNKKLMWRCLKDGCGEIFKSTFNAIFPDGGCGVCHGKQLSNSNCLAVKNPKLSEEWNYELNGKLTPYDVTASSRTKVYWKCSKCGFVWKLKIANRNKKNNKIVQGCPKCSSSHGEQVCREILIKNGFIEINKYDYNLLSYDDISKGKYFIAQKKFEHLFGLKNGSLSYDFYVLNMGKRLLIEYQGEQHEYPVNFKGEDVENVKLIFEKQLEHDRRKREYAKNNNIKLLEIWYYDFENIEQILNNELFLN